jgi:myo-inositol-1-phosphate synthase
MRTEPIRVAIAGVGNCASALVQGVAYYCRNPRAPGLIFPKIGGYSVTDVVFVAAFDINAAKVGKDFSVALRAAPNNARDICLPLRAFGWNVSAAPLLDGIGSHYRNRIIVSRRKVPNSMIGAVLYVSSILKSSGAQVLINYLPVGSERASRMYAEACLAAGISFINAIPVFIGSSPQWRKKFHSRGLLVAGDDIKSQIGATITHRTLSQMFTERGGQLDRQYQLNTGGNMDFFNMSSDKRLRSKLISKLHSVTNAMQRKPRLGSIQIIPSNYAPFLEDQKVAYIRLEGTGFAGQPISIETRLQVWDSDNSAACVVDMIRWLATSKVANDRQLCDLASAFYFKSPYLQLKDAEAYKRLAAAANTSVCQ